MRHATRVTKREWYAMGGFANSRCFRKGRKNGWTYWVLTEIN